MGAVFLVELLRFHWLFLNLLFFILGVYFLDLDDPICIGSQALEFSSRCVVRL